MTSGFGALVSNPQVERAILDTLSTWLPLYLPELERQNDLAAGAIQLPPTPESYVGGLDELSFEQDICPVVIAIVNPTGDPELDAFVYGQTFEAQIRAVIVRETEQDARDLAGYYGAAIMGAIAQNGDLGGLAVRVRLVGSPRTDFIDPDVRRVARTTVTFNVFVQPILDESAGPATAEPSDPPDNRPTVQTVDTDVTAEDL